MLQPSREVGEAPDARWNLFQPAIEIPKVTPGPFSWKWLVHCRFSKSVLFYSRVIYNIYIVFFCWLIFTPWTMNNIRKLVWYIYKSMAIKLREPHLVQVDHGPNGKQQWISGVHNSYPLVNIQKTIEHGHKNSWFIHFLMVMFHQLPKGITYQKVFHRRSPEILGG